MNTQKTIRLLEILEEVTDEKFKKIPREMKTQCEQGVNLSDGQKAWIRRAVSMRVLN